MTAKDGKTVPIALPADSTLPGWALAVLLLGLVVMSGMIVTIGLLVCAPRGTLAEPETPPVFDEVVAVAGGIDAPLASGWPAAIPTETPSVPHAEPERPAPMPVAIERGHQAKPPAPELNTLPPIAVAKIERPEMPYSIRRLGLPDGGPKPLKLAVSPVGHDDVGKVLKEFGPGYRFTTLLKLNLLSVEILKKYDVVFLTCADLYVEDFKSAGALRRFVEAGGTLYASDLQCDLIVRAFPEFAAKRVLHPGMAQGIDARVVDPALEAHLGRKVIPLSFDAPDWRPAAFEPSKVTVCLQGEYRDNQGEFKEAPLLVKFRVKQGTVIFTSFHHTRNDSAVVHKLLEYLVFSSVSARSDARMRDLLDQHASTLQSHRPVILNADQAVRGTCEHRGGGLQIALGFERAGARLKLTVRSPDGRAVEYSDEGLFLIDLPNAEPGEWTWTVTPLELPHGRFPIVVAVGKSKEAAKNP